MNSKKETLRVALWVTTIALVLAVIPIWPYGCYTLLRLLVTAVALFAVFVLGTDKPQRTVGLVAVALLFNPAIPVYLSRLVWLPIDLGVAFGFWRLTQSDSSSDQAKVQP